MKHRVAGRIPALSFRDTRRSPDILAILVREFPALVDVPEGRFHVRRKNLDPLVDCHVRLPFQDETGIDISKTSPTAPG